MQDLNRKDGAELRDLILQELEKQVGKEAVDSEINKIRQQGSANGLDISWEAALNPYRLAMNAHFAQLRIRLRVIRYQSCGLK